MVTKDIFSTVNLTEVTLPFENKGTFLKVSYGAPELKAYEVLVVQDSLAPEHSNGRLTTLVARYPRYIHSEALRHRVFSRNAASSRARSVRSTLRDVMENPVVPLFTVNQKGMGGRFSSPSQREQQLKVWLQARDRAVASVLELLVGPELLDTYRDESKLAENWETVLDKYYLEGYSSSGEEKPGYLSTHKQNFNRLLEPFMEFEEVITNSFWGNFLNLREAEDAQPEIRALAVLIRTALGESFPRSTWVHAPFIARERLSSSPSTFGMIKPLLLQSANECAQISYGDKSRASKSTSSAAKGEELFKAKHFSPFEHQAITRDAYFGGLAKEAGLELRPEELRSNLAPSWVQLRAMLGAMEK